MNLLMADMAALKTDVAAAFAQRSNPIQPTSRSETRIKEDTLNSLLERV